MSINTLHKEEEEEKDDDDDDDDNHNAHSTGRNTVWNLKPEQKGSTLVQEKYQEEKSSDKRQHNNNNNNNNNNIIQAKYLFLEPTKRVYWMKQKSVEASSKRW